jgi:hypothetical protein
MRKKYLFLRISFIVFLCLSVIGCATAPPAGFLKPGEENLAMRQLQIRQYDTANQEQIITAVAGVVQDLGFTLDDSETELGLVSASKKADASVTGQKFWAGLVDVLNAMNGVPSNASASCDAAQVVKASIIVKPSLEGNKTVVRITLQRVVWNVAGQVNRVESIKDPAIYQKFYDALSKAIFLEAQKI